MATVCIAVIFLALTASVKGVCSPDSVKSFNYIIKPWTNEHMRVDEVRGAPVATVNAFDVSQHDKFFYTTQFFSCPGENVDFVAIQSQNTIGGNIFYLANSRGGNNLVDFAEDNNAPFENGDDPRLFAYTGGSSVDISSFESKQKFVSNAEASPNVILDPGQFFWSLWPFITRTSGTSVTITTISVTFRINNRIVNVYLYFISSSRIGITTDRSHTYYNLQRRDLEFEIILWRLYKGFDRNGDIELGSAVVFRRPRDHRYYLTIDSPDGNVDLPHLYCPYNRYSRYNWYNRHRSRCFRYRRVQYKFYSDRVGDHGFADNGIRNRTLVDDRYFEVEKLRDGTSRLRSVLDPRKYLAILRESWNRYRLIVTEFDWRLHNIVNYNFRITVPARSNDVMRVPRITCDGNTLQRRRNQLSLFTCL